MEKNVTNETLTLIRGEYRIEVNKEKLANKSRYFASLFSHNFNDSHDKEHIINYDIAPSTLQKFVEWIHDDGEQYSSTVRIDRLTMKDALVDLTSVFSDLLNLLQLSVLFIADNLTNDIIELLLLRWVHSEKLIDVWLTAQELSLTELRDVCMSVCLDRFNHLPLPSLIELSKENFVQLIANVNVRSSIEYLRFVRNEWMQHQMISDIVDIKEGIKPKFVQGMFVHKLNESSVIDAYIYIWDGVTLSELVKLENVENSDKDLIGMQVAGRGFNIYLVGGQYGLENGRFNKDIRRYCLLSKKWYEETTLAVGRRHMIAVFLKNQLVIVGGVGRHRLKLNSVDIYNVHTGRWVRAAKVPECFTEVPPHCVMDGKLFFVKSCVYIYHPSEDHWETVEVYKNPDIRSIDAFISHDATLFLTGNYSHDMILLKINVTKDSVCEREECLKSHNEHSIISNVKTVHQDESCQLRYVRVAGTDVLILNNHHDFSKQMNLHVHTELRKDLGHPSFDPGVGYFNIIDPSSLYEIVSS